MRKCSLILFLFVSQLQAQHMLTLGTGLSVAFYDAEGMQRFTDTYNFMNQENLQSLQKNVNGSEGLRFETGYRYIGDRRNLGAVAGFQFSNRRNKAAFNNGESRDLNFERSSFYTEFEYGRYWNILLVNGLLGFNFKRELTIESSYFDGNNQPLTRRLNGTYKNDSAFSIDTGIAIGYFRTPFHLSLKVTYPVYVASRSKIFRDANPEKITDGTDKFPDDFFKFFDRETYEGLSNEFNGLKVVFTLAYTIQLSKPEESGKVKGKKK